MRTFSKHNQPATTTDGQCLTSDTLASHLYFRIVGALIAFHLFPLKIDGFACPGGTFEIRAHFFVLNACIDLRHGERTMAEQPANYLQRDILIDEAHRHGMSELM